MINYHKYISSHSTDSSHSLAGSPPGYAVDGALPAVQHHIPRPKSQEPLRQNSCVNSVKICKRYPARTMQGMATIFVSVSFLKYLPAQLMYGTIRHVRNKQYNVGRVMCFVLYVYLGVKDELSGSPSRHKLFRIPAPPKKPSNKSTQHSEINIFAAGCNL